MVKKMSRRISSTFFLSLIHICNNRGGGYGRPQQGGYGNNRGGYGRPQGGGLSLIHI